MDEDAFAQKKQRAAERVIAEIEIRHRERIFNKIRLTDEEQNYECAEFLSRVAAAAWHRAQMLAARGRSLPRNRDQKP